MKDIYYYSDRSTSSEYDNSKQLHRIDGPAIEHDNGSKVWLLNGRLHRVDGPAAEIISGDRGWYLDGVLYSEEEFNSILKEVDLMCLALQLTDPREWVRELGRKRIKE